MSLIATGICLSMLLGCTELKDLRKQNASLKSRLLQCESERDSLQERADLLGEESENLAESLTKAKEKERALLELVGKFQREQEEREKKLAELREMVKDIVGVNVVSRPEGTYIVLENAILFEAGEVELTQSAKETLDTAVVAYLKKNRGQQIRIDGHTDGQPIRVSPWQDNYHLAAMRALSVMRYLGTKGIPQKDMYVAGFGMNRPLVEPKEATDDMPKNRRVEILLIPEAGQGVEGLLKEFGR